MQDLYLSLIRVQKIPGEQQLPQLAADRRKPIVGTAQQPVGHGLPGKHPGHLINMFKVRGRRASIKALADKYGELALDKENGTVFISHGDCIEDAKLLEKMLAERFHAKVRLITYVGPVIGSHSGPGTLALFFLGRER